MSRLMISTDLDGTLLDHHTYSTAPAAELFPILDRLQIPWILNTSKTYSEVISLREEMGNQHPFIVENGSALYVPDSYPITRDGNFKADGDYYVRILGAPRSELIEAAKVLKQQFKFRAFSDLSVEDVIELTGLQRNSAIQAMDRSFTEPLVWLDSETALNAFQNKANELGLAAKRGGRFVHLMGQSDKARAQRFLADLYCDTWQESVDVIALGDGENDSQMLNEAEIAIQVRSPSHDFPTLAPHTKPIQTAGFGPAGWHEAISSILTERFDLQNS